MRPSKQKVKVKVMRGSRRGEIKQNKRLIPNLSTGALERVVAKIKTEELKNKPKN